MGTRRRAISAASRKRHRLGTLRATHNQARLPRITRGFLRDLRVIYRETLRLQLRNALGMHFICPQRGLRDLKRFWVGLETPRPLRFSLARPCIAKSCTPAIDRALSLAKAHHHPQTSTPQRENAVCWENVNMRDRERTEHTTDT